jgi:hypothetical protein
MLTSNEGEQPDKGDATVWSQGQWFIEIRDRFAIHNQHKAPLGEPILGAADLNRNINRHLSWSLPNIVGQEIVQRKTGVTAGLGTLDLSLDMCRNQLVRAYLLLRQEHIDWGGFAG